MNPALRVEIDNAYTPQVDITPNRLYFQSPSAKVGRMSSLFYRDEYQPDLTYSLPPQLLPSDLMMGGEPLEHDVHVEWASSSPASSPVLSGEHNFSPGQEELESFPVVEECGRYDSTAYLSTTPPMPMHPPTAHPVGLPLGLRSGLTPTTSRFGMTPSQLMLPPSDVQTWHCPTPDNEMSAHIRACLDKLLPDTPELELEHESEAAVSPKDIESQEVLATLSEVKLTPFMNRWLSDAKLRANPFWWRKNHLKCFVRGCNFHARNNWEARLHVDEHPSAASHQFVCNVSDCIHAVVGLGSDANLKRHKRLAHESHESIKCNFCNRHFRRKDSVRRHQVSRACAGYKEVQRHSRTGARINYREDQCADA